MSNRYPGKCYKCGRGVPAGAGRTWKYHGRWYVACAACDAEKRVTREGNLRPEGLEDFGAAGIEEAQGIGEGPARRRVRQSKGEAAEAARVDLYDLRAAQARKAFAEGRSSVYCGTCGCELEAFERGQWRERDGRCSVCAKRVESDSGRLPDPFAALDSPDFVPVFPDAVSAEARADEAEDAGEYQPTTEGNRQRREDAKGAFREAVLRQGLAAGLLLPV